MHQKRLIFSMILALAWAAHASLFAQRPESIFNNRTVENTPHAQDKEGIWMLNFHFKDPRLVTVNVPGLGQRQVWYLSYQVSNNTGQPRTFNPAFVWVCHDEPSVHHDNFLPSALKAIRRKEDPTGRLNIRDSVRIAANPIPVSNEFDDNGMRIAFPKLISGVATFVDVNPKCDRFSIYVHGLSNGWAMVDGEDGQPIILKKTLQLKFKRLGDEFFQDASEIRYEGHEWVYATYDPPPPRTAGR